MSAPVKYNPAGVAITDEKLIFAESEVIGETTYYFAWASNITDKAIEGNDSATYGVWTAVSKGGTRQTVLLEGIPDANEVTWDITTGKVLSLAQTSLYARYMGYGQILEIPQIILRYPFEMVDGVTNVDYAAVRILRNCTVERYSISVDGNTVPYPVTLQLRDELGGGGENRALALSEDERSCAIASLASPLSFVRDGLAVLGHCNGKGISIVTVMLY